MSNKKLIEKALDFRAFLNELRSRNDLVDVRKEVDSYLEVAAVCRRVYERRLPAPLFSNIRDALPGSRILGAPAGMLKDKSREYSRLALHFGLPENTRPHELIACIRDAMKAPPIDPVRVKTGPVKENKWVGDEVDLNRLPIPFLHEKDGGRYLGTYGFHIVQSPDQTWDSWSIGRMMLVDHNKLTGPTIPTQHIGMIRDMWTREGKPTPWAFALGAAPAAIAVSGMPLPARVSEPGYIGALLGQPLKVVQAETNNLWVPENAEIVLEGEISMHETAVEGPMGEYHGYQHTEGHVQPVFNVNAVTFRNNPILPICVTGLPAEENHTIWCTMISAQVLEDLQKGGLPVDMAWCSYEAVACWVVISVDVAQLAKLKTNAKEFADRVAQVHFKTHAGNLVPKVIIVGNDIDITNIDQVVWALASRAHPKHDFISYPDIGTFPLVPYLNGDDLASGKGGNMIINCLFPEQFKGEMRASTASFEHSYPASLKSQILNSFHEYGYVD